MDYIIAHLYSRIKDEQPQAAHAACDFDLPDSDDFPEPIEPSRPGPNRLEFTPRQIAVMAIVNAIEDYPEAAW